MSKQRANPQLVADHIDYIHAHTSGFHPAQLKLAEVTKQHPASRMISSANSVMLLSNMINFAGGKKCLEVGVFTGYSSLAWALSMPDDGKVVACDISSEYADIGKPFWKEAGVDHKIDLRIAPAGDTLQALIDAGESGTYDFMYIDADKTGYDNYYEFGLKLVRPGGIIAVDNCWWSGKPLDVSDTSPSTVAIRELNEKIREDDRVRAVMVNAGDGVYICLKN